MRLRRRHGRVPALLHTRLRRAVRARQFHSAVSLHAHTWYSREPLAFIEPFAARIPFVNRLASREITRYRERSGKTIDFSQAFFRPPLRPSLVLQSEVAEIVRTCDLGQIVSITDHDSIKAGQILRSTGADPGAPISLEWTVPFSSAVFHLGVHNLPPAQANAVMRELHACTAGSGRASLGELLEWLSGFPHVLVVLNHPFWDLTESGPERHRRQVLEFLTVHRSRLHALELNGFRTHAENRMVLRLARDCGLPVVSGGDRHGRAANAVLNLTAERTFDAFAAALRDGARSEILLTRAYRDSLPLRKLQTAADILRDAPDHPPGHECWTERIFYRDGGPFRRLRDHWPAGPPRWLDLLVLAVARMPFGQAAHVSGLLRFAPRRSAGRGAVDVLPVFAQPGHGSTP